MVKAAAGTAGLPENRFHGMRHTVATIMLTFDTYSHLIPAMHGDAAAVMDAVFSA